MTRYEVIKNRTIEEVAKCNINLITDCGIYDFFETSDLEQFIVRRDNTDEVYQNAYEHELAYLKEEECIDESHVKDI